MDLLIVLTYVAYAWSIFKISKIPINKWAVPTVILGGIFIACGLILLMNYNHPCTFKARKTVTSISVVPQIMGVVTEVTSKKDALIKKGEALFEFDPGRYQAWVSCLEADTVTARHREQVLIAQLDEMKANTQRARTIRSKLTRDYRRYAQGNQVRVNPFSERDIDATRQDCLAQGASIKSLITEQRQIQGQLDSLVLGENSQIVNLKAQLAEAEFNLGQAIAHASSDGYVTQVLTHPGIYAATLSMYPVMAFIPDQERQIIAQFYQNSLLRLEPDDGAEVMFSALPGKVLSGKLVAISPAVPGGTYQSNGALQSLNSTPGSEGVIATIELNDNADVNALPDGIHTQTVVYSDHFKHVSAMCRVLLRMTGWVHYLYLDH